MTIPVRDEYKGRMQACARMLSSVFGDEAGFALLVFKLDSPEGRMNYISNVGRADMVSAMEVFVAEVKADSQQTIQ